MALKLEFTTDNAAFDEGAATETARILRLIAARIEIGVLEGPIHDINGVRIGFYVLDGQP